MEQNWESWRQHTVLLIHETLLQQPPYQSPKLLENHTHRELGDQQETELKGSYEAALTGCHQPDS